MSGQARKQRHDPSWQNVYSEPSPLAPFLRDRSLLPKKPPTRDGKPYDVTLFVGRRGT